MAHQYYDSWARLSDPEAESGYHFSFADDITEMVSHPTAFLYGKRTTDGVRAAGESATSYESFSARRPGQDSLGADQDIQNMVQRFLETVARPVEDEAKDGHADGAAFDPASVVSNAQTESKDVAHSVNTSSVSDTTVNNGGVDPGQSKSSSTVKMTSTTGQHAGSDSDVFMTAVTIQDEPDAAQPTPASKAHDGEGKLEHSAAGSETGARAGGASTVATTVSGSNASPDLVLHASDPEVQAVMKWNALVESAERPMPRIRSTYQLTPADKNMTLAQIRQREAERAMRALTIAERERLEALSASASKAVMELPSAAVITAAIENLRVIDDHVWTHATLLSLKPPTPALPLPRSVDLSSIMEAVRFPNDLVEAGFGNGGTTSQLKTFRQHFTSAPSRLIVLDAFWLVVCRFLSACNERGELNKWATPSNDPLPQLTSTAQEVPLLEGETHEAITHVSDATGGADNGQIVQPEPSQLIQPPPFTGWASLEEQQSETSRAAQSMRDEWGYTPLSPEVGDIMTGGACRTLQNLLLDRLAVSYVALFLQVPAAQRDGFFSVFADATAQAVYFSLSVAYPSTLDFLQPRRTAMLHLFSYWMLGAIPSRSLAVARAASLAAATNAPVLPHNTHSGQQTTSGSTATSESHTTTTESRPRSGSRPSTSNASAPPSAQAMIESFSPSAFDPLVEHWAAKRALKETTARDKALAFSTVTPLSDLPKLLSPEGIRQWHRQQQAKSPQPDALGSSPLSSLRELAYGSDSSSLAQTGAEILQLKSPRLSHSQFEVGDGAALSSQGTGRRSGAYVLETSKRKEDHFVPTGSPWIAPRIVKRKVVLQHSGFVLRFLHLRKLSDLVARPVKVLQSAIEPHTRETVIALRETADELLRGQERSFNAIQSLNETFREAVRENNAERRTLRETRRLRAEEKKLARLDPAEFANALVLKMKEKSLRIAYEKEQQEKQRMHQTDNADKHKIGVSRQRHTQPDWRRYEGLEDGSLGELESEPRQFDPQELAVIRRVSNYSRQYGTGRQHR